MRMTSLNQRRLPDAPASHQKIRLRLIPIEMVLTRRLGLPDRPPKQLRGRWSQWVGYVQWVGKERIGADGGPGYEIAGRLDDIRNTRLPLELKDEPAGGG